MDDKMESIIVSSGGDFSTVNYSDEIITENFKPLAASTPIRTNKSSNLHIRNCISDGDAGQSKVGDAERIGHKETSSASHIPIYPDDDQIQDSSVIFIGIKEGAANRMTRLKPKLKNSGKATNHKSSNEVQDDASVEIAKPNRKRKSDFENNETINIF